MALDLIHAPNTTSVRAISAFDLFAGVVNFALKMHDIAKWDVSHLYRQFSIRAKHLRQRLRIQFPATILISIHICAPRRPTTTVSCN